MSDSTETIKSPPSAAEPGIWQVIGEAIRGSQRDYTEGSVSRAILLLAIPMVLEMVMESIFAVVDVFFVARLGADAVATIGITESLMSLIYAVAMGLAIGATAMVSRRIGEQDPEGASLAAVQAIALGSIVALLLAVLGVLFAPGLLGLMGGAPSVISQGSRYARVMFGGNLVIMLLFLINAIFRGAGDAAIAMRVLWLANIINILLGPCLIFGLGPFPKLGVTGAAVATTIGRGIGATYAFSRLIRPGGRVYVALRSIRIDLGLMGRLLRLSASGAFQVFIGMASWMGLTRINANFGSNALAGYTIGMRIILFALLPSWGMSNAAATLVGQGLGAGKPERAEQAVWRAGFYNLCFLGVVGLLFVIFADSIVGLFTADPAIRAYGISCLRIVALGFLFYAYAMVLGQSFNGAGDTLTPTLLNLFVFWLWEIPLAYLLAITFKMGPHGVFWSITISFSTMAVASAILFRRGKWKLKRV